MTICVFRVNLVQHRIQGAFDVLHILHGHVSIDLGRLNVAMAQEFLDIANVDAAFEQMGRERMPEAMEADIPLDARVQ